MRVKSKLGLRLAAVGVVVGAAALPMVSLGSAASAAASPVLTATPSTGVSNGVAITVSGTNFANGTVYIVECSALTGSAACQSAPTTATVADGAFSTSFTPVTGQVGSTASASCSDGQTCYLAATTDPTNPADTAAAGVATITFGGAITVTPSSAVKSGSKVTVAGSGFPDSKALTVLECANPAKAECDLSDGVGLSGTVKTSATGTFSVKLTVKTGTFASATGTGSSSCKAGGGCTIVATTDTTGQDPRQSAVSPFTFAGTCTKPTVTVTPAKNLKNGQKVSVKGCDFKASVSVYVLQCSSTTKGSAYCDVSDGVGVSTPAKTSASGTFSVKLTVKAGSAFAASGAKGSCAAGKTCDIVASTSTTGAKDESGFAPITIAASVTKIKPTVSAAAVKGGIGGVVKVKGKGFKGLKVELLKGKTVEGKTTSGKGGAYKFKVTKAGKYVVKTILKKSGSKEYTVATSKKVTIK